MLPLTHGSLFSGIEGFGEAFRREGIELAWSVEIEKDCQRIHRRHFPGVPIFDDVCEVGTHNLTPVDIITFGSPCFPAGTLINTVEGYVPIEDVQVGDMVLAHTGHYRPVLRTGGSISDTVVLKGFGHPGLETTPNHPFLASAKSRQWNNNRRSTDAVMSEPEWLEADDMEGQFWATPRIAHAASIPVPTAGEHKGHAAILPSFDDPDFWWFIGRYLGDGWVRRGHRSGRDNSFWHQIVLCCAHDEADALQARLTALGLAWQRTEERTATRFRTNNRALALWIEEHFGCGAGGKTVPAWAFTMNEAYRRELIAGYLSADGWIRKDGARSVTTVSKRLALGVRMMVETLGYGCKVYFNPMPETTEIEGRTVNQLGFYIVRWNQDSTRSSRMQDERFSWGKVRHVLPARKDVQVYNLEVAVDHSYVVENIAVHNCQDLSHAGKRKGFHGQRSVLFFEAARIIDELKPALALWENVPGAFTSNHGRDFAAVLATLRELGASDIAWRVLDAQYHNVPQRRCRVFLVADFRGTRAGQILFDAESSDGHFVPRSKTRKSPAAQVAGSARVPGRNEDTVTALTRGLGSGGPDAAHADAGWLLPILEAGARQGKGDSKQDGLGIGEEGDPMFTLQSSKQPVEEDGPFAFAWQQGDDSKHGKDGRGRSWVTRAGDYTGSLSATRVDAVCIPEQPADTTHALTSEGADASEDGTGRRTPLCFDSHASWHLGAEDDLSLTIKSAPGGNGGTPPAIVYEEDDVAGSITTRYGKGVNSTVDDGAVVYGVSLRGREGGNTAEVSEGVSSALRSSQGGSDKAHVLYAKGEDQYADALEADSREILHALRIEIGAEAFSEWGLGVLAALQSSEVLRPEVHGTQFRRAASEGEPAMDDGALSRSKAGATWALSEVWQAECVRRASQEWGLAGQRAEQLRAYLSLLSQPGASKAKALHDLWEASEGLGVLREALSTFQEMGRPNDREQGRKTSYGVRRLMPIETERLQGFPDDWTAFDDTGKPVSDASRYRMIGNAVAVPVAQWIARRMVLAMESES